MTRRAAPAVRPLLQTLIFLGLILSRTNAFLGRIARKYPNQVKTLASVLPQDAATTASKEQRNVLAKSPFLGSIYRIRMPGEDDEESASFLGTMGVPTFASTGSNETSSSYSIAEEKQVGPCRGLEGVLRQGPAFVLDNVMPPRMCQDILKTCEELGFGSYNSGKNHHGAMQILVSRNAANDVAQQLSRHIDMSQVEARRQEMESAKEDEDARLVFAGINRRWRIYRYQPGGVENFAPHIDCSFPPSGLSDDGNEMLWDDSPKDGEVVSRLTVLFYLSDDFQGGETKFYQPLCESKDDELSAIASVRPVTGSCLVFPQAVGEEAFDNARDHWPLHEGSPVVSGNPKYVIRSDVFFATEREPLALDDPGCRFDHLVRRTFLPKSPVMDQKFLGHLESLYNPHMGVENMGPFLYSFLRVTKKRKVVEIGAGFTSVWILQALKDNDDELKRIHELQSAGQCRLLDYPWTNEESVNEMEKEPASLLCIDNCEHQKETATGASAVAKSLGLDAYMHFLQGDAFELELEKESIDVLWCDFGVGSRMREFVSSAWKTLKPGGFLLCHSTLTNQHTRDWLEAARTREGYDATGIPPDEFVELSLLEPHKHYQNSVSIFQKRIGYSEPIYSEYA